MGMNTGVLTSNRTIEGDEQYTPFYACEPIVKYVPKNWTIWCPCGEEWSAYVQLFRERGYKVILSSLSGGKDFLKYEPDEHYDVIITNLPFSLKTKMLKRLDELGKPFAVLLPLNSLQGQDRFEVFSHGIQLLAFDKRIGFHSPKSMNKTVEGSPFASAYFCREVLPRDLILEELVKYERPLIKEKTL